MDSRSAAAASDSSAARRAWHAVLHVAHAPCSRRIGVACSLSDRDSARAFRAGAALSKFAHRCAAPAGSPASGLKSLPQCTQHARRRPFVGAASAATNEARNYTGCGHYLSGLKPLLQCTQPTRRKPLVGAFSRDERSRKLHRLRTLSVGAEAPPIVHPASMPQGPCRSGFSRDERNRKLHRLRTLSEPVDNLPHGGGSSRLSGRTRHREGHRLCAYFGVSRNRPPGLASSSNHSEPSGASSTSRMRLPMLQRLTAVAPPLLSTVTRMMP